MRRVVRMHQVSMERDRPTVVFCGMEVDAALSTQCGSLTTEIVTLADMRDLSHQVQKDEWGCIVAGTSAANQQGIDALSDFLRERPAFNWIIWSDDLDISGAVTFMRRGAWNVLERRPDITPVIDAIEGAIHEAHGRYSQWRQCEEVRQRFRQLSHSERQVLSLILDGLTNKRISLQLDMSLRTVEARRQKILRIMQTENLVTLAAMLAKHNMLDALLCTRNAAEALGPQPVSA